MKSRLLAFAAMSCLLAACNSSTDSGRAGAPARLDIVSGDAQQAVAGQELAQPLVVKVLDAKGKPVKGQIVNFRVVSGGGSVFAGAATTNNDGQAQERWTLGPIVADSQRVEARAVDPATGAALVFGTFKAVAMSGAPAAVQLVGDSAFRAPLGSAIDSLAARVVDAHGNPVANAQVTWAATAAGGTLSPSPSTTNAAGIAKARWTLGAVVDSLQRAEARLGASAVGYRATTTTDASLFDVTLIGDGKTGTAGTAIPQPVGVHVALKDGRPVKGVQAIADLMSRSGVTDAQGNAILPLIFPTRAGTQPFVVDLDDNTHGWGQAVFHFTSVAAQPARLERPRNTFWLGDAGIPAGTHLTALLQLRDAFGNLTPGVTVAWQVTDGNGGIAQAQTVTDSTGTTTNVFTVGSSAYHEIEATIPGLGRRLFFVGTSPHTYTARITPYPPDTLRVNVGPEVEVAVEVRDENGQIYPNTPSLLWAWYTSNAPVFAGAFAPAGNRNRYVPLSPGTATISVGRYPSRCTPLATCPQDDLISMPQGTKPVVVQ
jgi:hypothetical protein